YNRTVCDPLSEGCSFSTRLGPPEDPMAVYAIPLQTKQISVDGCKHFSYGRKSNKSNCTIMVLGATGAGKSTLINGMINYILGVEWEDSFRFKLTSEVTVYKLYHQEGFQIDYSLTIVDTPGFGDTRGIERDRMIVEQLRNLFSADLGVSDIHAVCFVAQASLARLKPTQRYVFDSVLSIFGKDVAENIRILVTFADGQRPPVLEAIKASGVPCPKTDNGLPVHFKFNNSALFAYNKPSERDGRSEDDEDGTFDKMFWNMGTQSMKRFFVALNRIEPKSLTLTKEVLKERQRLENSVEKLQEQVKLGLAKLEEIKETSEILKEHEAEISRNKDFEFEVTPVQVDISGTGCYITNCQKCHFTCHDNCVYANDADKKRCSAMGSDGYCSVCPGKCYWNVHFNQKYKWKYIEVKEKRTGKPGIQALVDKLKAEYDVQPEVVTLMETSAKCLNRLKEIALKPNPLSTPEYIDMLIEGEKSEAKPGWKQRVKALIEMREKAEYMAKVEKGEKLLHRQDLKCGKRSQSSRGPNTFARHCNYLILCYSQ
uniref:AIG1-type G domain-containing protein n=1 Tax=Monopterus albus TaxID=43700 RepID=A0A3Q3JM84_MONAL